MDLQFRGILYPGESLYESSAIFGYTGSYFQSRSETRFRLSKPSGKGFNSLSLKV